MDKTLCTLNGKSFYHDGTRSKFFDDVAAGRWEPDTFKVFDQYVQPGKYFIDIGAWNGVCALYAAAIGARVVAVEPDPIAHAEMFENIKRNEKLKIYSYQYAITDMKGPVQIHSQTEDGMGNSETSLLKRGGSLQRHLVQGLSLEEFMKPQWLKNLCLIKMDIEGGEVLVLPASRDFIRKHKPTMYISFHPAWFPELRNNISQILEVFKGYSNPEANGRTYNVEEFVNALINNTQHSFIFKPQ